MIPPDMHTAPPSPILSPVPELLGTNNDPTLAQSQAIERCLMDVDAEIQDLETQIQQMEEAVLELKNRKQNLAAFAEEHRALVSPSPIRRIPPELLSKIFLFFVRSNIISNCNGRYIQHCFDPNRGAFLFVRICRSWREVAIATPHLWANITFDMSPQARSNLVDLWLERSKACNLHIAVKVWPSLPAVYTASVNQALRSLISQAHRWESVALYLPREKIYWDPFTAAQGHLRRLKRLWIKVPKFVGQQQELVPDLISDASQLYSLSLSHCHFPISHSPTQGESVTQLHYCAKDRDTVDPIFLGPFLKGLLCFPNLKSLDLVTDIGLRKMSSPLAQTVTLQKVSIFRIQTDEGQALRWKGAADIWRALRLPNLTKLIVDCYGLLIRPDRGFSAFITQCPNLQKLELHYRSLPSEHFFDIFQPMSNLTSLQIVLPWTETSSCAFLEHLAARSTLPKLSRCIIVQPSRFTDVSQPFVDGFVEMVKSRMVGGTAEDETCLQFACLDARVSGAKAALIKSVLRFIDSRDEQLPDGILLSHNAKFVTLRRMT